MQVLFGLPLLKANGRFAQDQEIWGVVVALHLLPRIYAKYRQLERVRLVKKFKHIRIMIHDEDGPQELHFVALELDGDSHLVEAGIGSAHVVGARRDTANGLRIKPRMVERKSQVDGASASVRHHC